MRTEETVMYLGRAWLGSVFIILSLVYENTAKEKQMQGSIVINNYYPAILHAIIS